MSINWMKKKWLQAYLANDSIFGHVFFLCVFFFFVVVVKNAAYLSDIHADAMAERAKWL